MLCSLAVSATAGDAAANSVSDVLRIGFSVRFDRFFCDITVEVLKEIRIINMKGQSVSQLLKTAHADPVTVFEQLLDIMTVLEANTCADMLN